MVKVYNSQGVLSGEMALPKALHVEWNPELIHQVLRSMEANRRSTVAHTKDRAEVRGGGKKPWNQKGTGRARHGSIRSPIWKGGGTTFGPRSDRDYSKKINKKMLRKAVLTILSKKAEDGELKAVENFEITKAKTKLLAQSLKPIIVNRSAMLVVPMDKVMVHQAARNLARVKIVAPNQLNVYDLMNHKDVVFEKSTLETYGQ